MLWQVKSNQAIDLTTHGVIMGIVNVTPDSFSDGGRHATVDSAVAHGIAQWHAGAAILDVGGQSTRPGAADVPESVELARVLPVIAGLRAALPAAWISIDTMKAEVARQALAAGADIINDITGLTGDPLMIKVAAAAACGVVVMHMQGSPRTMQAAPTYTDVVAEVTTYLRDRLDALAAAGIPPDRIAFDPGIGFGKTVGHNLELMRALTRLAPPGRPLLVGVSRKSFIGAVLGSTGIQEREWPTVALTSLARERGARIIRVHDVAPNHQALRMTEAILAHADHPEC
jgi:dihydropteroate synthase